MRSLQDSENKTTVINNVILRDECPLKNESIQMFSVNVVWIWNPQTYSTSLCLFTYISQTVFLSIFPSIPVWSTFCAPFICAHCCHHTALPSLRMLTFASPSRDSVGVVLYDRRLRNTGNGASLYHYDKQEKKKAATFPKCHFGNFQLTSDHNSLSSTLCFTEKNLSPFLKQFFDVSHYWLTQEINFLSIKARGDHAQSPS